jgi:Family of unknown function (DUF5335)
MTDVQGVLQRERWHEFFDQLTREHPQDEVAVEILDEVYGDNKEVEWMPLAFVMYDPKDDQFVVGIGGRGRRYPVVLQHFIDHPQEINIDLISDEIPYAIRVIEADGTKTVVSIRSSA